MAGNNAKSKNVSNESVKAKNLKAKNAKENMPRAFHWINTTYTQTHTHTHPNLSGDTLY